MATSTAAAAEGDALRWVEETTGDAHRVQLETLRCILERNAGAGYLRRHLASFAGDRPIDAEDFRRLVPLSSYDDYAELIQSVADGDEPPTALSFDPLLCFFYSSGTSTMRPKLIPFFDSIHGRSASQSVNQARNSIIRRLFPPRPTVNKILWFLYAGNVTETKGGFKVMAATAFPFHYKGPTSSPLLSMCVSPAQVILGSDTDQQTYCHLLCGLRHSASVDAIRAPYAASLVRAFRLLESTWKQLCDDIGSGSVSSEITDPSMRDAMRESLGGPQPELAARIQRVCEKSDWGGIVRRLWPDSRYMCCVTTGSMEQYYPLLKYYAGEGVPLVCGDYSSSECPIALNMDKMRPPEQTSFTILPNVAYFEFLPFEMGASSELRETVDISGVEVGKLYEMVVTTYRGLYRYRMGDVVKVVGFHNSSPLVQFITRAPKETAELFTERDLMSAMECSFHLMPGDGVGEVIDFAGCLDSYLGEKHVIIFVEVSTNYCMFLQGENSEESEIVHLAKCCQSLEDSLGSVYKLKRANGDIGPAEICIVKPGSFDELARVAMEKGASAAQYKPPKIIRNHNLIDQLKASVICKSRSSGK